MIACQGTLPIPTPTPSKTAQATHPPIPGGRTAEQAKHAKDRFPTLLETSLPWRTRRTGFPSLDGWRGLLRSPGDLRRLPGVSTPGTRLSTPSPSRSDGRNQEWPNSRHPAWACMGGLRSLRDRVGSSDRVRSWLASLRYGKGFLRGDASVPVLRGDAARRQGRRLRTPVHPALRQGWRSEEVPTSVGVAGSAR